ncbi:MAG TPA: hypothetical protein VMR31_06545 [Myxococcota bacterium]|nr:hypothetical protein [Myxococcota bacterium]
MSARAAAALGALLFGALACARPREPITDCNAVGGARPVCGFHNPEDLALLPGGRALVASQLGSIDGSKPGSLVFYDLATDAISPAFPTAEAAQAAPSPGWGDPHCPGPPGVAFDPHGIDLALRPDGARVLLAVNHGGRESIELFELAGAPDAPALHWRGCAVAPDDASLNAVAGLPDGGLVTTKMTSRTHPVLSLLAGLLRLPTGCVLEWQPATGFRELAGTGGSGPNGVAVSRDGEVLYVDEYFSDQVRKIARRTGELLDWVEVASPDNIHWTPQGFLLVASHNAPFLDIFACADLERGQCPFYFSVLAVEPKRLVLTTIYENGGPPMGAGTVAVRAGDEIFVGTFAGDRILRFTLADWLRKSLTGA